MKRGLILGLLAVIVVLPFALRPRRTVDRRIDDTVVIITPHNEAIRSEFARGFASWYHEETGRTVGVDWRVIGGTSDIARFLESEFSASFEVHWTRRLRRRWSAAIQAGFQNGRLPKSAMAPVREARAAFLASEVGCGIDVFFGGGIYDFERQALAGRLVDSGLRSRHPEWFTEDIIPRHVNGEDYWHADGLWVGTVLSAYGIVFNRDGLKRLGFEREPEHWDDLADIRLVGEVALADPTKSGSVAKAFENILQYRMQLRLAALAEEAPASTAAEREHRAVREGWLEGMRLLQRMGANARYFTDTSQKPPIDVAAGNCVAGLCIDFYGRQQQEAVRRRGPSERVGYVSPAGGTVASVDPIGLLRGAPHREVAIRFIEYVLSLEGQKLWNFRPGTPGGPRQFALRRIPIRRDFHLRTEWRSYLSDPGEFSLVQRNPLIYRAAWTGRIFREMAFVIRVMAQDTHVELARAWRAILAAPEPARSRALAVLQDLSAINYDRTTGEIRTRLEAQDKVEEVRLARDLGRIFRRNYRRAEAIARDDP